MFACYIVVSGFFEVCNKCTYRISFYFQSVRIRAYDVSHSPEIFLSSIVAVGAFNPAIFSPDWMEARGLIGADDANVARTNKSYMVSSQVTAVQTEWFALQVLENQFSVTSQGALTPALKDLAIGMLTLLPQTPISAIGLNFTGHYKMASHADFNKIGDLLVPKKIWYDVFGKADAYVGMQNITVAVQNAKREDNGTVTMLSQDQLNITVQPSGKVKLGVYISCNEHRNIASSELAEQTSAERAASIVEADWQNSWDKSSKAFDDLLTKMLTEA